MLGATGAIRRVDSPTKQSQPYMSRASEYRRLRNGGKCRPEGDNFSVEERRKERYAELKISRKGPDYVVKRAALKGAMLDLGAVVAEGGDVGPECCCGGRGDVRLGCSYGGRGSVRPGCCCSGRSDVGLGCSFGGVVGVVRPG